MNMHGAVSLRRAIMPKAGPEAYKSYSWRQPLETHFRRASCEETRCQQFVHGWVSVVDLATELGQHQHHFITHDRERQHTAEQAGTLVSFTFPPGTRPFDSPKHEHRKPIGYDPIMLVTGGDFRGNPRRTPPVVMRPQDWVDDFATHQDRLARAQR
jgi:hypothetical protein